jgi:hypothetical protein
MPQAPYGINMVIHGPSKHGKALSLDTVLPTPTGWITMGEVQCGDELFNDKGEVTRVIAVGPIQFDRPCRRVAVMGDEITADAAHLWRVFSPWNREKEATIIVDTDHLRISDKENSVYQLPWTPVLQLPDQPLPIPPYVLGAWLGDGAMGTSRLGWTDERKIPMLKHCLDVYGEGDFRTSSQGWFYIHLPGLKNKTFESRAAVLEDGVLRRRIPSAYLRAGIEQRRELLAGLMDTDGWIGSRQTEYTSIDPILAAQVAELACSLGIRAHVRQGMPSKYLKNGQHTQASDHYDVLIRGVVKAHRLTHRPDQDAKIPDRRVKRYDRIRIKSVTATDSVPVRCIQVDDENGMFLAGRSMIPTHNSTLADTCPSPRIIIDAEGGSRFTPSTKRLWDPLTEPIPAVDGTWESAIVHPRNYDTVLKVYEILDQQEHPFRSVVMDSISEVQQKCVRAIAGVNPMQTQDWGTLLRKVSDLARGFRDLITHPLHPLDAVVIIAMTKQEDGKWIPFVQGQLKTSLPYYFDLCTYLCRVQTPGGAEVHRLFIAPVPGFETGERVGGRLGAYRDDANIAEMLDIIRNERPVGQPTEPAAT